jgi:hypothetical protein
MGQSIIVHIASSNREDILVLINRLRFVKHSLNGVQEEVGRLNSVLMEVVQSLKEYVSGDSLILRNLTQYLIDSVFNEEFVSEISIFALVVLAVLMNL